MLPAFLYDNKLEGHFQGQADDLRASASCALPTGRAEAKFLSLFPW